MKEIFRDIKGYEGLYQISNLGRIWSVPRKRKCDNQSIGNKFLKPRQDKKTGYLKVALYKNGKAKVFYVHRLVALHFIPNPSNLPQINHKDGDKTNNSINNLEWVTASQNIKDSFKKGRIVWNKGLKTKEFKKCLFCGEMFYPKKPKQIYCSKKCSSEANPCKNKFWLAENGYVKFEEVK